MRVFTRFLHGRRGSVRVGEHRLLSVRGIRLVIKIRNNLSMPSKIHCIIVDLKLKYKNTERSVTTGSNTFFIKISHNFPH